MSWKASPWRSEAEPAALRLLTGSKVLSTQTPKRIFGGLRVPQKDLEIRSLEPYGKLYKDYIGVIKGLYRGSTFEILPGVWARNEGMVESM